MGLLHLSVHFLQNIRAPSGPLPYIFNAPPPPKKKIEPSMSILREELGLINLIMQLISQGRKDLTDQFQLTLQLIIAACFEAILGAVNEINTLCMCSLTLWAGWHVQVLLRKLINYNFCDVRPPLPSKRERP